ncbi:hypothetical protein MVQ21_02975 [Fusobacterium necrophorum]|uniref:hypothetical protein n=1 Tax=Fusobacterium necrophorum TaxID=859 RepID=UPI0025516D4A|nr:hypothetical protein [Fusobacterium necrophorum]MDK4495271.1 hypothetical protein [Fusobacterium necrophorum]MDK4509324.1 hypothetical protein [Fusobacterium necrophorum]
MKLKLRKLRKKREIVRFRKSSLAITEYKRQSIRRRWDICLEKFLDWKGPKWFFFIGEIKAKAKKRGGKNR